MKRCKRLRRVSRGTWYSCSLGILQLTAPLPSPVRLLQHGGEGFPSPRNGPHHDTHSLWCKYEGFFLLFPWCSAQISCHDNSELWQSLGAECWWIPCQSKVWSVFSSPCHQMGQAAPPSRLQTTGLAVSLACTVLQWRSGVAVWNNL